MSRRIRRLLFLVALLAGATVLGAPMLAEAGECAAKDCTAHASVCPAQNETCSCVHILGDSECR